MPTKSAILTPPNNIVLVGFMGCGKSTIGRAISQELGYPLIDTDQYIEEQSGTTISEMFATQGEEHFRNQETELINQLRSQKVNEQVISTGGGILKREQNHETIKSLGYVVWLKTSVDTIIERTGKTNNRPLMQCENPVEHVTKMLKERNPAYEKCSHLTIQTDELSITDTVHGIIESARYFLSNS